MHLIEKLHSHTILSPDKIAIQTSTGELTYGQLLEEVLRYKNLLSSYCKKHKPAVVCLHRSPRLVSVLLALQWLEIPYIPLDPKTPTARIRTIIKDSQALLFCHDHPRLDQYHDMPCKVLPLLELPPIHTAKKSRIKINPKSLAYIIYTSGSTGTPKGVCITHHALSFFLEQMARHFMQKETCLLAITTIAFDIAGLELYLPLWQGKTIFLANDKEHKNPESIQKILLEHPIDMLQSTPAFWRMLLYSGWQGDKKLTALCGGEALTPALAKSLIPCTAALWNMYGPTEATIWCALKKVDSDKNITVGKPIHGMKMQVLDKTLKPVPPGIKGELYISGPALATGYLNRKELTHEKFMTQGLGKIGKSRLYKTGDVALKTLHDEFCILGRTDNQVKLHGFRIELEEIEAHIDAFPGVKTCAVTVYQEQLVAYICKSQQHPYRAEKLLEVLKAHLPEFMIPTRFIYLDKIPLNTSGKLDRNALPPPKNTQSKQSVALNETELKLQNIWQEVLGIANCNIEDNFFALGGHSLLAARLIAKIGRVFQKQLQISDIYKAPSIQLLAKLIPDAPTINEALVDTHLQKKRRHTPLTEFQFLLWSSKLFDKSVKKLNIVGRKRIKGELDKKALEYALETTVKQHDLLSYKISYLLPFQKKKHYKLAQWTEYDYRALNKKATERKLSHSFQKLSCHKSWFKRKTPIIAKCFLLSGDHTELHIAMPHLIADQQSLDIFFHDLSKAYLAYLNQQTTRMSSQAVPFTHYATCEHTKLGETILEDEQFWKSYFADTALVNFHRQDIIKSTKSEDYSSYFEISSSQIQSWQNFCIQHSVSLTSFIAAASTLALNDLGQSCKLPKSLFINTVKSTREEASHDHTIGCFLRTYPIKIELSGDKNIQSLAKNAQLAFAQTAAHQNAPSLVKLASIGHLESANKYVTPYILKLLSVLLTPAQKISYLLTPSMFNAYHKLAQVSADRTSFMVNINIWQNFLTPSETRLFGKTSIAVEDKEVLMTTHNILDICLMRDSTEQKAFLVVSANLAPTLREKLGLQLITLLQQSL